MTGIKAIKAALDETARPMVAGVVERVVAGQAIAWVAFDFSIEVRTVRLICAAYLHGREERRDQP